MFGTEALCVRAAFFLAVSPSSLPIHLYLSVALSTSLSLPPTRVRRGHSPGWATSCCCLTLTTLPANTTSTPSLSLLSSSTWGRAHTDSFNAAKWQKDSVGLYMTWTPKNYGLLLIIFALRWNLTSWVCLLMVVKFLIISISLAVFLNSTPSDKIVMHTTIHYHIMYNVQKYILYHSDT